MALGVPSEEPGDQGDPGTPLGGPLDSPSEGWGFGVVPSEGWGRGLCPHPCGLRCPLPLQTSPTCARSCPARRRTPSSITSAPWTPRRSPSLPCQKAPSSSPGWDLGPGLSLVGAPGPPANGARPRPHVPKLGPSARSQGDVTTAVPAGPAPAGEGAAAGGAAAGDHPAVPGQLRQVRAPPAFWGCWGPSGCRVHPAPLHQLSLHPVRVRAKRHPEKNHRIV